MKKGFRVAFIILMLVILYLPILILAVYSFTDSANIGTIPRIFRSELYYIIYQA